MEESKIAGICGLTADSVNVGRSSEFKDSISEISRTKTESCRCGGEQV
ncbi:MAG: hypothetical protein II837_02025 [Treponema sp.]|nr:hypothetical protein [Treponema sp.]MBQ7167804.1 hypothetical protein [Treponema sp.]